MKYIIFSFIFLLSIICLDTTQALSQIQTEPLPGTVTLTFDDGPNPDFTPKILAILKKYNIKATFFVLGPAAEKYPELIKEILSNGHAIGIHSMTHPDLTTLNPEQLEFEVVTPKEIITKILGKAPICFRPPFDATNMRIKDFLTSKDLIQQMPSLNSFDYMRPGTQNIVAWVLKNVKSGSIILMHDGTMKREESVEALPYIIEGIKKKGLGFSAICYP